MNRLLLVAKTALCLAGTALLLCGCWFAVQLRSDEHALAVSTGKQEAALTLAVIGAVNANSAEAAETLNDVDGAARQLDATLAFVNRPCNSLDRSGRALPQGTLCGVDETLKLTRLTMGQITIAARHEDSNLATLDRQEATLYGDTHAALSALPAVEANAATAIAGLNDLERSPQLTETLTNTASVTQSAARIAKDGADEADKLAHPAKKKLTFMGGVWAALTYIHKLLPPIF